MISAERLRELYEASPNVLLRVTDNELRGLGPLIRDVLDELAAARSRIASLERDLAQCNVSQDDLSVECQKLRAQGLSQEDREACLRAADMNEQRAGFHSSLKYGDEPEAKPFRDDAAILRRLGGQTT